MFDFPFLRILPILFFAVFSLQASTTAPSMERSTYDRLDHPGEAARFRAMQQSVNGVVRPDGLIHALAQRRKILMHSPLRSGSTIQKYAWKALGPDRIGGRVRSIWIHPKNRRLIFVGTAGGGIWKSTDAGASWKPVNDFLGGTLAISCITADPRTTDNPDTTVLYASTGEGYCNHDAMRGYGIFRSTDGGKHWTHLPSSDPLNDPAWYTVDRIAVSPKGVIIAAGFDNAIFVSRDNGAHWKKHVIDVNGTCNYRFQVLFDPYHADRALVAGDNGIIFSTKDAGKSWKTIRVTESNAPCGHVGSNGRVELAYAQNTPDLLYASVAKNEGEIYRSDDGGQTWHYLSSPGHLGAQGAYDNTIWVDPTDASHLVIGGLDLYRSDDGGVNWDKISTWYYAPYSPHADHHCLVSDPSDPSRLYDGNDGGVYGTDDIDSVTDELDNNGWSNLNNGLAITQFYDAAAIPGSRIVGGAQDNGDLLHLRHRLWKTVCDGDGGFSGVAPKKSPGKFFYYGEYVYLMIHRSDNGKRSRDIYNNLEDSVNQNANFIAPFAVDPRHPDWMLAGGISLWRSRNIRTASPDDVVWERIKAPIDGNVSISQITISSRDSNRVLIGYNNGEIYKSTNATDDMPTWTRIHEANGKMVLALQIDKNHPERFYAGFGGYSSGNLIRSTDGGASWKDISVGLPDAPMRSIVRNPLHADFLYVGTEVGIFTSTDGGKHWQTGNNGPATVSVDRLRCPTRHTLIAATHGRGVFQIRFHDPDTDRHDVDGDGIADPVFRNFTTGKNRAYLMDRKGDLSETLRLPPLSATWSQACLADINRDGFADAVFFSPSRHRVRIITLDRNVTTAFSRTFNTPDLDSDWRLLGSGDVNEDGRSDLFFRNRHTGENRLYTLSADGRRLRPYTLKKLPVRWEAKGIADINNDGIDDLIFRNRNTGQIRIQLLRPNGLSSRALYSVKLPLVWTLVGVEDFNGDGVADLFYRNRQTGRNRIVLLQRNGTSRRTLYPPRIAPEWHLVQVTDFNDDMVPDLLYHNRNTGKVRIVFLRNDGTKKSRIDLPPVGSHWSVIH